jgi:hypothetical protein
MDIIATSNPTLLGWWIREQTASLWGHVLVAGLKGFVYTADWRYSKKDAFKYLMDQDSFIVYRIPGITDDQKIAGIQQCESWLGQWYPVMGIISLKIQYWLKPERMHLRGAKSTAL